MSKHESARWQKLADIPADLFQEVTEELTGEGVVSAAALLKKSGRRDRNAQAKQARKQAEQQARAELARGVLSVADVAVRDRPREAAVRGALRGHERMFSRIGGRDLEHPVDARVAYDESIAMSTHPPPDREPAGTSPRRPSVLTDERFKEIVARQTRLAQEALSEAARKSRERKSASS